VATDRNAFPPASLGDPGQITIRDFGEQWIRFPSSEGFYASLELLDDLLGPLLPREVLRNARIADIGSGTGRIVNMLLAAGAAMGRSR
jgi:hypothetical protein